MTATPGVVVARKQHKPAVTARTVRRAAIPAPWPLETATERDVGTVVLVAGSAGTGKTTLLAWWADELGARGDAVGWAGLDREDDDPAVLAQSVVEAVHAGLGAEPEAELRTTGGGAPVEPRVLVDRVLGGIAADRRRVWLLLDDVHVVHSAGSRALLDRLIRWAPANLHLVLASRSEPDLHLARLRLEERLVEVREPQLRFSLEETGALLGLHGLDLEASHVDRLHQLTEGWPAGLGLAAVSLAHGRDTETFLREFAHNDRAISSYLVEEVLSTFDPEVREFLVTTSVLERVEPEAAAAVSGRQDARAVLLELSADSAMVTADPGGDAAAFRYHSLLRSHLSALLASRGPGQQRRAHRAAARWCLDSGRPRQALHHAREAGDDALASEVIRRQALHLLTEGQADEVSRTVAGLATDDPLLTGLGALALGELSDPQAAREALDRVTEPEPSAEPQGTSVLDGVAGGGAPPLRDVMRLGGRMLALISSSPGAQDDPARTVGASAARGALRSPGSRQRRVPAGPARRQGNGRLARTDPLSHHALDLWLLAGLTDGGELLAAGWFEEASQAFHDVLDTARLTGHSLVALQAMSGLASVCAGAEDLRGMDLWSGRALRAAEGTAWQRSPRLLPAFVLGAWAAYGRMDDEDAHRRNEVARALLAESTSTSTLDPVPGPDEGSPRQRGIAQLARLSSLLDAHLTLARDRSPSSSYAVARGALTELRAVAAQSLTGRMALNEVVSIHELLLRAGCARMAPEVEALGVRLGIGSERLGVMTALRLFHEGDDEAARELVHAFLSKPGSTPSWRDVVKAQLTAAVLAHRRGQPWRAQELLVAAMERAAPERAVRLMVDTVPGVPDLLVAGAGRFGLLEPFASELLTHVADVHPLPADRREGRLTTRELSLLRELPSLLTVKEIAAARSVSANTVKTQLRSIFDKLGVSSRREAVAAGRRLGLI